jgi:hypothetical protein
VWEQAYARTYVVQVSTGTAHWTDVARVDNRAVPLLFNRGNASRQVKEFDARTARFGRIVGGVRQTSWGNSLWSLSVIDSRDPGTDLALHRLATASTEEGDHPAAHATDGGSGTRWSSHSTVTSDGSQFSFWASLRTESGSRESRLSGRAWAPVRGPAG